LPGFCYGGIGQHPPVVQWSFNPTHPVQPNVAMPFGKGFHVLALSIRSFNKWAAPASGGHQCWAQASGSLPWVIQRCQRSDFTHLVPAHAHFHAIEYCERGCPAHICKNVIFVAPSDFPLPKESFKCTKSCKEFSQMVPCIALSVLAWMHFSNVSASQLPTTPRSPTESKTQGLLALQQRKAGSTNSGANPP
jgi:hypothetical protein